METDLRFARSGTCETDCNVLFRGLSFGIFLILSRDCDNFYTVIIPQLQLWHLQCLSFVESVRDVHSQVLLASHGMLYTDYIRAVDRGEFRPRQTRQLSRAVDLKGRLLSCQSY